MATGTDIYQTKLFSRDGGGNFFQNVSHWLVAPDGTDDPFTTAKFLADAYNTSIVTKIGPCMSDDGVMDALWCRKIGPAPTGNTYTKVLGVTGTVVQPTHSGAVALNLNLFTGSADNHGHFYVGGIPETFVVDDAITGAAIAAANPLITALAGGLMWGGAGTAALCVYTRKTLVGHFVSAIQINASPAILKRRVRPFG